MKQEEWETEEAVKLGMCKAGCDCGHCEIRRACVNRILSAHTARLLEEVEGMKKDEENIQIPSGENIGEYRFCEKLKRNGYNQALSDVLSLIQQYKKDLNQEKLK
jgi:hypothetical protein